TGHCNDGMTSERKRVDAYGGSHASCATPSTPCITLRTTGSLFALFTACTTTGIVASLPTASVLVSRRSRVDTGRSLNRCALARSIRCGKSTFHGCGGTYGHFVM